MGPKVTAIMLLLTMIVSAQSKRDSLKHVLAGETKDTTRIAVLQELFGEYRKDSTDKARQYIVSAISLAEEIGDFEGYINSRNQYADFLREKSEEDSALVIVEQNLELALKEGYTEGASDALLAMGGLYWQKGNFEKTREVTSRNIALSEELQDHVRIARSYITLGGVHAQIGEYTRAMDYYTLASDTFRDLGDLEGYATALGNIGYIQRSLENYQSAATYFRKGDSISKIIDDPSGMAFAAYNLSVVYKNLGQFEEALEYNKKGLKLYEQLGNRKRVSYCFYTQGEIYRKKELYVTALDRYQKALELARVVDDSVNTGYSLVAVAEMHLQLLDNGAAKKALAEAMGIAEAMKLDILLMDIHKDLADIFEKEQNTGDALAHMRIYASLRDSLYTRERREMGTEIEAKYQNKEKQKEIALLASQKDLQALQLTQSENQRKAIFVFALFALVLAGLLFYLYRVKKRTNRELNELNRVKSDFFANITHEFRTPLTLIKGPIEQLEQKPESGLEMETIKMIRRNTNRVLQLVNQLLDLSRIDKGNLHLDPTEGDIYACLRAATSSFNSHAAQRRIDYQVNIPSWMLWASFDRDKLEKIIYNLLSNAFKFSEDGSTISIQVLFHRNILQIEVTDSGRGIPPDKLPFIFDRFYQVDSSMTKEKEGSGIGLSLSKDLVELMDGTITAQSELNKGSSFTIHLPIKEIKTGLKPRSESPVLEQDENSISKTYSFNTDKRNLPTVLLIEDNADMRRYIRTHLEPFYRIREAQDGEAGLSMATNAQIELIITDLMMPRMDGLELSKKLKSNIHTSHIPVIMLTAKTGTEYRIEGLETGADDYLYKPFDTKELLVRVKNLIDQRQRLRIKYSTSQNQIRPNEIAVTSLDERFLDKLLGLLEEQYSESDFGVVQMQKTLAMSKTQLHRKLKALTNESPGELLRNFRLKRAAQLLRQKEDSVTQIAYKVGFNNLSYFAKCFKQLYGQSPSSY